MTFAALDLHKRYTALCALADTGELIGEARRLLVDADQLLTLLAEFSAPVTVAMEATLYWQWLNGRLEAAGHRVLVADARQVKIIWQTRTKTDPIDARKLAELARANLLPTVWVPDPETRRRRQVLHGRAFLVKQRTKLRNAIHGYLSSENLLCPTTDLYGRAGRAWLGAAPLSPIRRDQVDRLLRLYDALTGRSTSSMTRSSDSRGRTR